MSSSQVIARIARTVAGIAVRRGPVGTSRLRWRQSTSKSESTMFAHGPALLRRRKRTSAHGTAPNPWGRSMRRARGQARRPGAPRTEGERNDIADQPAGYAGGRCHPSAVARPCGSSLVPRSVWFGAGQRDRSQAKNHLLDSQPGRQLNHSIVNYVTGPQTFAVDSMHGQARRRWRRASAWQSLLALSPIAADHRGSQLMFTQQATLVILYAVETRPLSPPRRTISWLPGVQFARA